MLKKKIRKKIKTENNLIKNYCRKTITLKLKKEMWSWKKLVHKK